MALPFGVDSNPVTAANPPLTPVSGGTGVLATRRPTPIEWTAMWLISGLVVVASYFGWWTISVTEAWGFATGGVCVWLVVREHLWNWPMGLANNLVFFVLFFHSRLYADMGLQVIYFGLGVYGWLHWVHGGKDRSRLLINRASRADWLALAVGIPIGTWVLREVLVAVNGAAPFWDSLTTVLSLAAQYLLCRKRLENWFLWIVADIIYVPLYLSRGLPLTAILYGVFLVMCLFGVREWTRNWKLERGRP
jgi:nicotinamide mononucleotide transporter